MERSRNREYSIGVTTGLLDKMAATGDNRVRSSNGTPAQLPSGIRDGEFEPRGRARHLPWRNDRAPQRVFSTYHL